MPSGQQARLLLWRSKVDSSLGESTFFSVKMLFEKEQKEAGFGPFLNQPRELRMSMSARNILFPNWPRWKKWEKRQEGGFLWLGVWVSLCVCLSVVSELIPNSSSWEFEIWFWCSTERIYYTFSEKSYYYVFGFGKKKKEKFTSQNVFLFLSIGIVIESTLSVPKFLFCHTWARSYQEF